MKWENLFRFAYVGIRDYDVIEFDPTYHECPTGITLGNLKELGGFSCEEFSTYYWLSICDYDILEPTNLACMLYGEKNES